MTVSGSNTREAGFSLVELMIAMTVLTVGLIALSGVTLMTNRMADYDAGRSFMLSEAQLLLEEIRGTSPALLIDHYDGVSSTVTIDAAAGDELVVESATLDVAVTEVSSGLLEIGVAATWSVAGETDTFTLMTGIYAP